MTRLGMNIWLVVLAIMPALPSAEQSQSCPVNIDFSKASLVHWDAYTGNNKDGNGPGAIKTYYYPGNSETAFPEYNLPSVSGIRVITYQGTDPFGSFPTIPTINGYTYHYSVLLGSTSVAERQASDPTNGQPNNPAGGGPKGGYIRGISYDISVPSGPSSVPYTMTYAYAMVLENGTHASELQPMARAILTTPNGVITCASPSYFLPTDGGGLDTATAQANGFSLSPVPTPNESRNPQGSSGVHLQDVWTKGWTEVTFDLTPYRGQQVTLTFEADNCVPGGHFAYAYFAVRDVCAGLQISGDTLACSNSIGKYSIPSLDSATYDWSVPDGWQLHSDRNDNAISVTIGAQPGWIVARQKNSCTSLTDSLFVQLYPGALPQATAIPADTTICYGESATLRALVTTGTDYTWVSSGSFAGDNKGVIQTVPFTANILAAPKTSANYILNVHNEGCPITVADTITLTIVQPIKVNLGNDTLVVVNQPLHFQATSSDVYKNDYEWTPATGLSDPYIADPVGLYGPEMNNITYLVKATDVFGCSGTASVKVTIAPTLPDIFVPNAFTPEKSQNNLFRPVCMGIASLEYFRVYNRWGQLLYSTSQTGHGWDGRVGGRLQEGGAYLWMLRGTDYTGKVILKKGTMMLIR
ncbi:MAG TPA: gliding motility-associated C-terminal domain-containing protein [Puia sp.]|nr:gliding motility-associated C-terminal domain-containing protein [Puia sp.]